MDIISNIRGKVIPLPMNDVDTDMIIPAQFLTSVNNSGFGANLFRRLRDSDPLFPFNQERFSDANILVSQKNFGCGSSREHAVWALLNAGISAVIAESFSDIFFNNASKNGLVLIKQHTLIVEKLIAQAFDSSCYLEIDLQQSTIKDNDDIYPFELDAFHRHCFLNGLDHLDYLLSYQDKINQWEKENSHVG